jgi:hypothetical protein
METPNLSNYQNNNFDFELTEDLKKIVCYHYYGKYRKFTFKIICEIPDTATATLNKATARIKKAITEAKKHTQPLHGCTDYLPTIKI